jgi:hypothetical protein
MPTCRFDENGPRLRQSRNKGSGPCHRQTKPLAPCPRVWPRSCARSCALWAHKGCAGEIPGTCPWLQKPSRPSSGRCWVAEGGNCGPADVRKTTTGPLKNGAALQNLGDAIALQFFAGRFLPLVAQKGVPSKSVKAPVMRACRPNKIVLDGRRVRNWCVHGFDILLLSSTSCCNPLAGGLQGKTGAACNA